jgi:hypothetical protein
MRLLGELMCSVQRKSSMHCNRRKNNLVFCYAAAGRIIFLHSLGQKRTSSVDNSGIKTGQPD